MYRNKSKAMKTNQATWSNASQLDDKGQETDSSSELSTVQLQTESKTTSSSEATSNTEDSFVSQPRGYLVEESKSSSDQITQDCNVNMVVLIPLTVIYFK